MLSLLDREGAGYFPEIRIVSAPFEDWEIRSHKRARLCAVAHMAEISPRVHQ